jgi:hypothetical protein
MEQCSKMYSISDKEVEGVIICKKVQKQVIFRSGRQALSKLPEYTKLFVLDRG